MILYRFLSSVLNYETHEIKKESIGLNSPTEMEQVENEDLLQVIKYELC
jgi:hypothetical protein